MQLLQTNCPKSQPNQRANEKLYSSKLIMDSPQQTEYFDEFDALLLQKSNISQFLTETQNILNLKSAELAQKLKILEFSKEKFEQKMRRSLESEQVA